MITRKLYEFNLMFIFRIKKKYSFIANSLH